MVQKEQQKLLLRQLRRPTSARIATIPKERHTLHHGKNSAERRSVLWTFMLTRIKTAVARAQATGHRERFTLVNIFLR